MFKSFTGRDRVQMVKAAQDTVIREDGARRGMSIVEHETPRSFGQQVLSTESGSVLTSVHSRDSRCGNKANNKLTCRRNLVIMA